MLTVMAAGFFFQLNLAPVLIAVIVGLALVLLAAIRQVHRIRRDAAEQARRGRGKPKPKPRGTPAWVWVLLITVVAVIAYLSSGRPRPGESESAPVDPVAVWVSILVAAGMFIGLIVLQRWRERRNPVYQAMRQANAGDIPGAIAAIEARIARRQGRPVDPTEAARNPYAAPAAAITPAQKRTLGEDYNVLGVFEGMRKDWAAALARFEEANQLIDVEMPAVRANRGIALVHLGRSAEGLAVLDEVLDDLPRGDHLHRCVCLSKGAIALLDLGRPVEARDRLDRAEAAGKRIGRLAVGSRSMWEDEIATIRVQLEGQPPPTSVEAEAPLSTPTEAG